MSKGLLGLSLSYQKVIQYVEKSRDNEKKMKKEMREVMQAKRPFL